MSLAFKCKGAKYNKNEQLNYERPPIPNIVAPTILNALPKNYNKNLKDFYDKLYEIHTNNFPSWRFGQFIMQFFSYVQDDPFYYSNQEFEVKLQEFVDYFNRKYPNVNNTIKDRLNNRKELSNNDNIQKTS